MESYSVSLKEGGLNWCSYTTAAVKCLSICLLTWVVVLAGQLAEFNQIHEKGHELSSQNNSDPFVLAVWQKLRF